MFYNIYQLDITIYVYVFVVSYLENLLLWRPILISSSIATQFSKLVQDMTPVLLWGSVLSEQGRLQFFFSIIGNLFVLWQDTTVHGKENHGQETVHEENTKSCEHEYGSYCLWSTEHREVMKDTIVKRLKDQLFIARAHYPSVAKLKQQERFTRELKQNIQEHERMLSDTITDADLPPLLVSP